MAWPRAPHSGTKHLKSVSVSSIPSLYLELAGQTSWAYAPFKRTAVAPSGPGAVSSAEQHFWRIVVHPHPPSYIVTALNSPWSNLCSNRNQTLKVQSMRQEPKQTWSWILSKWVVQGVGQFVPDLSPAAPQAFPPSRWNRRSSPVYQPSCKCSCHHLASCWIRTS